MLSSEFLSITLSIPLQYPWLFLLSKDRDCLQSLVFQPSVVRRAGAVRVPGRVHARPHRPHPRRPEHHHRPRSPRQAL